MPLADACPVTLAVILAKGTSEVMLPRCYGVHGFVYFSDGPGRDGVEITPQWGPASVGGVYWIDPQTPPPGFLLTGGEDGVLKITWDRDTIPDNFVLGLIGVQFSQAGISAPPPVALPPP